MKHEDGRTIDLSEVPTPDILAEAGRRRAAMRKKCSGGRPISCDHEMGGDEEEGCLTCQRRNATRRHRAKAKAAQDKVDLRSDGTQQPQVNS